MKNQMKHYSRFVLAAIVAVSVIWPMSPAFAFRRDGSGEAQVITEDAGNTLTPFNVSVGTTTAVKIYDKLDSKVDRKLRICNSEADTYRLLVSTSSGINGLASTQDIRTHDMVLPNSCNEYIAFPQDMYVVFRASATTGTFSAGRVFGYKRLDSRD